MGSEVQGSWVQRFRVHGFKGSWVHGFKGSGFKGSKVQGSWVLGPRFRVHGSKVQPDRWFRKEID